MARPEMEVQQRAEQIREVLGDNASRLLAGYAASRGLDGGASVVEGVIQTFAKGDHEIPNNPQQIIEWMRSGIDHAADQVNTPGGEGIPGGHGR